MRTRRSNRAKRYTLDQYDFLESGDEEASQKSRKTAEDNDENFEAAAEERSAGEDEEEERNGDEGEDEGEQLNGSGSDANGAEKPSRQHSKGTKQAKQPKQSKPVDVGVLEVTGYLDIELVPPEGQHKGYVGPYDRGMRGKALARTWFGPNPERISMAHELLQRWSGWTIFPPKVPQDEDEPTDKGFWFPGGLDKEARLAEKWHAQMSSALPSDNVWAELNPDESVAFRFPPLSMPMLTGPQEAQLELSMEPGRCYSMSQSNVPYDQDEDDDKVQSGWVLDVGGIVLGMDWAPRRDKNPKQMLALAIIPPSDQDMYNYEEESVKPGFQKQGIVQIWEFQGITTDDSFIRPSSEPAILRKTLCLDCGRIRRVRWSPSRNHIAFLCGDGSVYIADAGDLDGQEEGVYYILQRPLAVLSLADEYAIKATAMTWVNCNRMAVGYSDGSIALWSIYPQCLLSRHPVHHNDIIDMASGYPTMPTVIVSLPVGGTARIIDLRAPSYEVTEAQRPLVHTQPGLLGYSDHLLGFVSIYPSASALNTIIGFLHHAHFPVCRRLFTGDSFLTCLAVGRLHPFLLIGAMDGSLWCLNAQTELYSNRHEMTDKIRIFRHEHRPGYLFPPGSPVAARGVCRVLHGFGVDKNRNSKPDAKQGAKNKGKKLRAKEPVEVAEGEREGEGEEDDDEAGDTDPSRATLHEALTRITAIEWNPNLDYGCWAAVAMGSGLVRVIDLGLEAHPAA
ncbi:WD40-repeat-containing domain protein [Trichoderma novae-zelandiae]